MPHSPKHPPRGFPVQEDTEEIRTFLQEGFTTSLDQPGSSPYSPLPEGFQDISGTPELEELYLPEPASIGGIAGFTQARLDETEEERHTRLEFKRESLGIHWTPEFMLPIGSSLKETNDRLEQMLGSGYEPLSEREADWNPFLTGVGETVQTGVEKYLGDIATQVTGAGFRGERVDVHLSDRKRLEINSYISQIFPEADPEDVRKIAARAFDRKPFETINDPVQLREMSEQREAQRIIEIATRMANAPESTQEIIGQVLGSILTLGRAEPPLTLDAIGRMHPILQAALIIPGVGAVAGPGASQVVALGGRIYTQLAGATLRTAVPGVAGPIGRQIGMQFDRVILPVRPELDVLLNKAHRIMGEIDETMLRVVLPPTNPLASTAIIGLREIQPGLTRGELYYSFARRILPFDLPLNHGLSTPAMKERARVFPIIDSQANRLSNKHHAAINKVFRFNKKHQIEDLDGIDPTLPTAPTIQDVAARLPTYRHRLSEAQLAALRTLENDLKPYRQMLDEAGVELGTRTDVMTGGFYIPRGLALEGGIDHAVKVPARGVYGGKEGFEKSATMRSQAAAIDVGYEYASITQVLRDYATHAGRRALNLHVINYMKALRDEEGRLIGLTPSMRIDPQLRNVVDKIRSRIAGRRRTEAKQNTRMLEKGREAAREERKAERAGERVGKADRRASNAAVQFSQEDLTLARHSLRTAIEEAQTFAYQAGENAQYLKTSRAVLRTSEAKLVKEVGNLETAIKKAVTTMETEMAKVEVGHRSLQRTVSSHLSNAKLITTRVNKLADRVEKMSTRVDDLIERGEILKDVRTAERGTIVEVRRAERALVQKRIMLTGAEREMRALTMEHNRTIRAAGESGERLKLAEKRHQKTTRDLQGFEDELESWSRQWDEAIEASEKIPEGFAEINLSGLQRRWFPIELANAANNVIRGEGRLIGEGFQPALWIAAYNRLIRGMNSTLDNSATGLQGLLGLANDPRAYFGALKVNVQAWGRGGDKALGRFIQQFDDQANKVGRINSEAWATLGLRIGGANIGEFMLGQGQRGLANLPGVRHANRAFGFFGDTLRLEWADDMLLNELSMGRTLSQIRASGDLDRIAEIANNMTGYSRNRAGGSLGELVLFAPRFLQSRLETVARAGMGLRPGATLDQRIARRSILKMIGFTTMLTISINEMQGHDTDFRPWVDGHPNPNFNRTRFGNRDFALMGTWDSLAKAMMLTATGRPDLALRNLSSPLIRQIWDLSTGKTAIGERTHDTTEQFIYYMLKAVSPFFAQEIPEAGMALAKGDVVTGGVTLVGEVLGMKSGPMSFTDQEEIIRRELYPDIPNEDLDNDQLRRIRNDPKMQALISKFEERQEPVTIRQRMTLAFNDVESIKTQTESRLRSDIDGGLDGPNLRRAISKFKQERFLTIRAIFDSPEIQDELEKSTADQPVRDALAEAYWTTPAPTNPAVVDEEGYGIPDFDFQERKRDAILAEADALGIDRSYITGIDAPIDTKTGTPKSYRGVRYEDATVRAMIELFEADSIIMESYLRVARNLAEERGLLEVYQEWHRSTDPNFLKDHPFLNSLMSSVGAKKISMRKADINLERKLWKWGYVGTAKNSFLAGEINALRERQGGEIINRLAIDREPAPPVGVAP